MSDKPKIVYPWSDKSFSGTKDDKIAVYDELSRLGYPIKSLQKTPSELVQTLLHVLMTKFFLAAGEWVCLISDSAFFLREVCDALPVVFALTKSRAPMTVTNETVSLHMSHAAKGHSIIDLTDSQKFIRHAETAGLLVWENINQETPFGSKYGSKFLELLTARLKRPKTSNLFTLLCRQDWNEDAVRAMYMQQVEAVFGQTATAIIEERCIFKTAMVRKKMGLKIDKD